jgi:Tol biopolymer transport system component
VTIVNPPQSGTVCGGGAWPFAASIDVRVRTSAPVGTPPRRAACEVCVLHDVGRAGDLEYLVMQFLDGETLAARLERGPLPVAQALDYASQMAAALDRAHRAGIVHRDLKPGNVMLARAGSGSSATIKLLDFGLATAAAVAGPAAAMTMSRPLTGQGTIVGTLQYMSPEQLEGRQVDARTDIFALGSILYEMLTGHRAFEAASQAGVMAAILEKEPPPLSSAQPLTPPGLDRVVQRCLAKDPDARWQSASDLAAALSWLRTDSGAVALPAAPPAARRRWIVATAVAAALVSIALLAVSGVLNRPTPTLHPMHLAIAAPPFPVAVPELSPDGTMIVWSGSSVDSGRQPLWLQPLDTEAGRPIPGTEGATYAFWSPDGRSIGFFADQKLKRIAISGGAPITICDVADADPRGGSWGPGDVIIFSGARIGALSRVPASGGTPLPLTILDAAIGHTTHRWPRFLPDGRHFVFFASRNIGSSTDDMIMFGSLDGQPPRMVIRETSNAAFADGRLLYVDKGRLVAQRFDESTGTVSGDATPVLENVRVGYGVTRAMFSAVGAVLVAMPSNPEGERFTLQWLAASGSTKPALEDGLYDSHPWLSPDGRRVVVSIVDSRARRDDIWTVDVTTGARTRLTFNGDRWSPVWSRDGGRVFYLEATENGRLLSVAAGGGEEVTVARNLPRESELLDCSTEYCLFGVWQPAKGTNYDLLAVRLSDGVVVPAAATEADENDGHFSPDGRFIAYGYAQGGEENVFVRMFPSGGQWQVSTNGGHAPFWSRDGRTLYFVTNRDIVAVPVSTSGGFSAGPPAVVALPTPAGSDTAPTIRYAQMAPDGRMLAEVPRLAAGSQPYRLVLNWNR